MGLGSLIHGVGSASKKLEHYATASLFSGDIQQFLPVALQYPTTRPILNAGVAGIGQLIQNPGALAPNVSEAIAPRLAMQSQQIAQNFRNIQQNQAGGFARTNTPLSIRQALASALDVAQARAQREARMQALSESDILRRQDIGETFALLDAILQYSQAGRGQAVSGLGAVADIQQKNAAAQLAFQASLADSFAKMVGGGGGGGGGAKMAMAA